MDKEKIKEFWDDYKAIIITALVVIIFISFFIVAVVTHESKEGEGFDSVYNTLVSWGEWFGPILKSLAGIALIKYILLDWK